MNMLPDSFDLLTMTNQLHVTLIVLPVLSITDRGPLGLAGRPAELTWKELSQQETLSQNQKLAGV